MECRLQQSDAAWRSQVHLRFEMDLDGNRFAEVKEIPFGPVVHDTMELEKMLRRAQLAVLNPTVFPEKLVDLDVDSSTQLDLILTSGTSLKFSSNVVCIDVSGPHVPDLTFTDLPGALLSKIYPTWFVLNFLCRNYIQRG